MKLTAENYFSLEADREFMSCSQFKVWDICQLQAYHRYVLFTIKQEDKKCFDEGHFTHAYFESREAFRKLIHDNLETFTYEKGKGLDKKRVFYANYKKAIKACQRVKKDEIFMWSIQGQSEKIYTGEFAGCNWKIKVDFVNDEGNPRFTDLKFMRSLSKREWLEIYIDDYGIAQKFKEGEFWVKRKMDVKYYEFWDYWRRFSVYHKILSVATGKSYIPILSAISKEDPPDFEVKSFDDEFRINMELNYIESKMPEILDVKLGRAEPKHCGVCAICRKYKKLTRIEKAESIFN